MGENWKMSDNYKKLTLLPYKKNIDQTVKNWHFIDQPNLEHEKDSFYPKFLQKNHIISTYC